jgi:hypothetical protein
MRPLAAAEIDGLRVARRVLLLGAMVRLCARMASMLALVACGSVAPSSPSLPGDALSPGRVVEVGALWLGETQTVRPPQGGGAGKLPAFRVESFGGVVLDIDAWGEGAVLVVQGPLPGIDGDGAGSDAVDVVARAGAGVGSPVVHLTDVRLTTPGVYRVVVADQRALAERGPIQHEFALSARCTAGLRCERDFMRPEELNAAMTRDRVFEQLELSLDPARSKDPATRRIGRALGLLAGISGSVAAAQEVAIMAALPRGSRRGKFKFAAAMARLPSYPLLPVRGGSLPSYMDLLEVRTEGPEPLVEGNLVTLLGECDVRREHPVPTFGQYSIGNFPDLSLTPCEVSGSVRFAYILNSLATYAFAAGWRAKISYRGRVYDNPAALVGALLDAGHHVELRETRSNVQLTTLSVGGKDMFWPLWIETGLKLDPGEVARVPMARSRVEWRISGPDVNARIGFGMHPGGTRFDALVDRPPAWVGYRVAAATTSAADVVESLRVAARYLDRDRSDRVRWGGDIVLGTGSDTAAVFLRSVWGYQDDAALPFPLLRGRRMDNLPYNGGSGEQEVMAIVMAALPHDSDDSSRADWQRDANANRHALERLYNMMPFDLDSPLLDLFPSRLRREMCQLGARRSSTVCSSLRVAMAVP